MLINFQIEISEDQIHFLKRMKVFSDAAIDLSSELGISYNESLVKIIQKEFLDREIIDMKNIIINGTSKVLVHYENDHGQVDIWLSKIGEVLLDYV